MTQPKIVFVTQSAPHSVGNGGNHRSYQINYDLQQLVAPDAIRVFARPNQAEKMMQNAPARSSVQVHPWNAFKHRVKMFLRRIASARENPFYLVGENNFSLDNYLSRGFVEDYEKAVRESRPQLAVIDHAGFAPILAVNQKYGIPTIACPQNLESLDASYVQRSRWNLSAAAHNWSNELTILGQCSVRLCISKVETAAIRGLGYTADYYAYQPVGEVSDLLRRVRQNRQVTRQERSLFLMPGSAFHHSTREGMLWLLQQIRENNLPDGIHIVIIGAQSHNLPPVSGVTAYGWINQEQLEHYLTIAAGILIPQFRGFGTPTKLVEFASAGIPIIASEHITFAVDPLPNVWIADQEWEAWRQAMCMIADEPVLKLSASPIEQAESCLIKHVRQLLQ